MHITRPAVGQAQPTQQATSSGDASTNSVGGLDSTFTQLLVAQLKSQDPLDPMDPTQFVSQLVGLNTLDAVTQIYQLLQSYTGATTSTGSTAPSTSPIAGGN